MYSVLVAEDESIIRKGIIFSIDWEKLGIKLVGEAENGEEGSKLIEKLKPDIVITDINMPVIDGLEMIKRTKDVAPYSAIIITGYSEFAYAKEAIDYGVTGYLLKPYSDEELEENLKMAIKQCKDREKLRVLKNFQDVEILPDKETNDHVVKKILNYIYDHYSEKITVTELEKLVSYSERMINIKFREEIGTTVIDFLNRYRIKKAMHLLNDNSVNNVAIECGFGDYKYFGVVFKKYIGMSPKEWVKKHSSRLT